MELNKTDEIIWDVNPLYPRDHAACDLIYLFIVHGILKRV